MAKTKISASLICLCAMFTAISIVLSQIAIPIGLVPINFVHTAIFTSVGLMGVKYGTMSQVVFVLMGAVGLPVFSGFSGGLWRPGGGFIVGYILCALVAGYIMDRYDKKNGTGRTVKVMLPAMYAGWVATYVIGVPWFMFMTGASFAAALPIVLIPFLPGDALKTVLSIMLVKRLSRHAIRYRKF